MAFTERFTGRADAYVRGRPSYPVAAVDAAIAGLEAPPSLVVADLGAGTGISSRAIAARGPRVLAIEPNAAMRGASQPDPRIEWIDGTAEHTTLEDDTVDAATAFQAWHWVDFAAATAEVRRIVRPGGCLAIVYNERDERDAFTAAYGDIVREYAVDRTEPRRTAALEHALSIDPAATRRSDFSNTHTLDRTGLHERANSTSYLPQSGPDAETLHGHLDTLFDRFAVAGFVAMVLQTTVVRIGL